MRHILFGYVNTVIYHKSTCITCKKTISEFDRMKKDIQKRDFFKEPFSESELKKIIKVSRMSPREFLRKKDKAYKELNLENSNHTEAEIVQLMLKNPGLIKRPIIFKNNKIHLGKIQATDLKLF